MTEYGTWIPDSNLRAAMEGLAVVCGYVFEDSDWIAIEHGLKDVNEQKGIWFDYPLIGKIRIDTSITIEPGSSNYSLMVYSEHNILNQVHIVEFYVQGFLVTLD